MTELCKHSNFVGHCIECLRAERDALLAELAEYRTLRPAKCNAKCYYVGWKAAQEAAIEYYTRWTSDSGYVVKGISDGIRALVPPADCGGQCNPLEPAPDEFDGIMCQCACGCLNQATRYVDGLPSCEQCYLA